MKAEIEPRDRESYSHFVLVCVVNFFLFMSFYLTLPLLSGCSSAHVTSTNLAGFIMGTFTFAATAIRLWAGPFADRSGRIRLLRYGLLLQIAAELAYLIPNMGWAILGPRAAHGVGWGMSNTALNTMAADFAPRSRRGEFLGYLGMIATIAIALGPAAAISLARVASEPALGFVVSCACIVLAAALGYLLPEPPSRNKHERGVRAWGISYILPGIVVFGLTSGYGAILAHSFAFGRSIGIVNPGVFFTILGPIMILIRPIAGKISDIKGRFLVIASSVAFATLGLTVLALANSLLTFLCAATLYGIGFGGSHTVLMALAIDSTESRGAAVATFVLFFDLGITLGSIGTGWMAEMAGYREAFLATAVLPTALASALLFYGRVMKGGDLKDPGKTGFLP